MVSGRRGEGPPGGSALMMSHLIGVFLLLFGAPLVGLLGNVIAEYVHEGVGRTVTIGGVLAVTGVAGWLIVRSF